MRVSGVSKQFQEYAKLQGVTRPIRGPYDRRIHNPILLIRDGFQQDPWDENQFQFWVAGKSVQDLFRISEDNFLIITRNWLYRHGHTLVHEEYCTFSDPMNQESFFRF